MEFLGDTYGFLHQYPIWASALGSVAGTVTIESDSATTRTLSLNGTGLSITPLITLNTMSFSFDDTQVSSSSNSLTLFVDGDNLNSVIDIASTEGFEVSIDGTAFSAALQIPSESANSQATVFVRFAPIAIGDATRTINIVNSVGVSAKITSIIVPVENTIYASSRNLPFRLISSLSD